MALAGPSANVTYLSCLAARWHSDQVLLPPRLAARTVPPSLSEAGGPVIATCPFPAGSRPVISSEC